MKESLLISLDIMNDPSLTRLEKIILAALYHPECTSLSDITDNCNLNVVAIKQTLKSLDEKGAILRPTHMNRKMRLIYFFDNKDIEVSNDDRDFYFTNL
jgi:DNA-binding MarR family transcriptional regulator